jgi:hypothetical protein
VFDDLPRKCPRSQGRRDPGGVHRPAWRVPSSYAQDPSHAYRSEKTSLPSMIRPSLLDVLDSIAYE